MSTKLTNEQQARKDWLSVLAMADKARLREIWEGLDDAPSVQFRREPEIGLAMVRGRAGGTGGAFNLGEVSVTRCVVSVHDSQSGKRIDGVSCIAGRDKLRAELVAKLDALFQDSALGPAAREAALSILKADRESLLQNRGSEAASTKVDFFTMERGH